MKHSIFAGIGLALLAGCAEVKDKTVYPDTWAQAVEDCKHTDDKRALAGSWLYEERGYFYTLHLDQQGKGDYEWRNGLFLTSCLDKQVWRGRWVQKDKVREGGFEIRLSKDLSMGGGRWWYTRIGEDIHPQAAGGEFQVKRIKSALSGDDPPRRADAQGSAAGRP